MYPTWRVWGGPGSYDGKRVRLWLWSERDGRPHLIKTEKKAGPTKEVEVED